MSGFNIDDYVDVAERISQFYERFPDGRLTMGMHPQIVDIGGKPYVWYHARAFRTPDDPLPGDGWAAEPVPGPTQFTRDSELMNAETAAWGRAIVALGFATKKIASVQEMKARVGEASERNTREKAEEFAKEAGFDFWQVAVEILPEVPANRDDLSTDEARAVCKEIADRKKAKP